MHCIVAAADWDGARAGQPPAFSRSIASVNKQQAARVGEQCGLGPEEVTRLARSIAGYGRDYQAAFLQHSSAVADVLIGHGAEPPALGPLLKQRHDLFTKPAGEVDARMQAMLTIGLTPAEAAAALKRESWDYRSCWANLPLPQPVLAARAAHLRQLGLAPKWLLAAHMKRFSTDSDLLSQPTQLLEQLEAVLQEELGGGRRLFVKWLRAGPYFTADAAEQLRRRTQLLVQARPAACGRWQ